jgi:hypothetical protein
MSEVPTQYFYKEILSNKVWLPNGKLPAWEPVGNDVGVLSTNDAFVIFHLTSLAHKQVGGIVKITEGAYQDAKKNALGSASPPSLPRGLSHSPGPTAAPVFNNPVPPQLPKPPTPAAAPVVPAAIEAKPAEPPQKVRVGRLKRATPATP